jgi:hypothetical protein
MKRKPNSAKYSYKTPKAATAKRNKKPAAAAVSKSNSHVDEYDGESTSAESDTSQDHLVEYTESSATTANSLGLASSRVECLSTNTVADHFLIGQDYCCRWMDQKGKHHIMFGSISSCVRALENTNSLLFSIELDANLRGLVNGEAHFQCQAPDFIIVKECYAWGGCLLFNKQENSGACTINGRAVPHGSLHFVPRSRFNDSSCKCSTDIEVKSGLQALPCRSIAVLDWKLTFQVKESSIPNAGLGVFVRATPFMADTRNKHFILPPGHLIDMGVYAPLTACDAISNQQSRVKCFIHGPEATQYNIETALRDEGPLKSVFDPTDHVTGELHGAAKRSVMPFINQADRSETPNVRYFHDPTGAVHYLFGCQGKELKIKGNKDYELLIDYGSAYSRRRFHNNLTANHRDQRKLQLENVQADLDFVEDYKTACPRAAMDSLAWLDSFTAPSAQVPLNKRARALLLALVLRERCIQLVDEYFYDRHIDTVDGLAQEYRDFMDQHTLALGTQVLGRLLESFVSADNLHESLVAEGTCRKCLPQILDCRNLDDLTAEELQGKLTYMLNRPL